MQLWTEYGDSLARNHDCSVSTSEHLDRDREV